MDEGLKKLQEAFGEQRIRTDELISGRSLLKIGGAAQYYLEADRIDELTKVVKIASDIRLPIYVLGTGSSTIVADKGIRGLVIKNNCRKFDVISRKGKIRNNQINVDRAYVYADSGVLMNQLVRFTIEQNLSGLENHLGVAGTVGGNLFRRTKENEILNDYLYQIQVIDPEGKIKLVDRPELFQTDKKGITHKSGHTVLSVVFELFPSHKELLWDKGTKAIEQREKAKPKNQLSILAFEDISKADAMSIPTPGYTTSAQYLIENAGIKEKKYGNVEISNEYPGYLTSVGDAKADEFIELIKIIQNTVHRKFGVWLQCACTIIEE